jgi:tetrapyrrole methylase family protein/MazG family protein
LETIDRLFSIIKRLRGEGGCEWDRAQTPETMWKCLAEEMYELEEAIAKEDSRHICEELGDVLFQLAFIFELFQEKKMFTVSDVVEGVAQKMIRRHPHVYGDSQISGEKELNIQWDSIKRTEQKENGCQRASVLDSVPKGMPSLVRALKVSKCAAKEGFEWDNVHDVLDTVKDEIREFEEALKSGNKTDINMEFGDILFSLVNVARVANFHPETALADSTAKFEGRFRLMEEKLNEKQLSIKNLSRSEIDSFWDQAKKKFTKKNNN